MRTGRPTAELVVTGEVGLRVAVNTGEVVVSGAEDDAIGDPVNVAARDPSAANSTP